MALAIIGFIFPHAMNKMLEDQFTDKIIHTYREDPDLQNLIDFAQQEVSGIVRILGLITTFPRLTI